MTPTLTITKKPSLNRRQVEALSLLAKLLATENIRVQHSSNAVTASFDTKSRMLTLPVWSNMSGDLYDMLVAHEVGHALYTPKGDGWVKQLQEIAGEKFNAFKGYVNIVEDARIEREMKDAYPGLRSTFARAYRDLTVSKPKLMALDRDLKTLPLIDRVNIHYKVGFAVKVPFTAAEMALVRRVAETESWDEVVALAKEFFDFSKQQKSESKGNDDMSSEGGEGEDQEGKEVGESSDEDGEEQSQSGNSDEGEDEGETAAEGDNDDAEDGTEGGEETGEGSESADGEEAEEGEAEGDDNAKSGGTDSKGKTDKQAKQDSNEPAEADESVTEKALESLSEQNRSTNPYESSTTVRMPTFNTEAGIMPFAEVLEDLKLMAERNDGFRRYQQFLAKNRQSINSLVQEFMRRKAADEANRTRTADTGSIDPSRLWAYRISEEIFGSYEVKKEGKNHGIVFLLDWSGSMNRILEPTIMQLACLVQFCSAASIPCEVYAFSDAHSFNDEGKIWSHNDGEMVFRDFRLLNILSSSAKPVQIKTAIAGLLAWAKKSEMPNSYGSPFGKNAKGQPLDSKYYLNGTPLNAAIAAMVTVVPKFKAKTNVQIVNTVILTDGDATDRADYRWVGQDGQRSCNVYTDPNRNGYGRDFNEVSIVGRRAVERFLGYEDALIRFLRVEADCNVIGFRIDGSRALSPVVSAAPGRMDKESNEFKKFVSKDGAAYVAAKKKFLRDEGWVSGEEWYGYTEWFGVTDLKVDEVDYFEEIDETATKAKLAKALSAEIGKNKSSRPLMARIAARVSKR